MNTFIPHTHIPLLLAPFRRFLTGLILPLCMMLCGCRQENIIFIPEEVPAGEPQLTSVAGFYLLNEGNMGTNKATLDRYDYRTATLTRNIYAQANPDVPKELGDVGNDLRRYGSRLYAVINGSNKVEVMHLSDCRRIGQVDIPNCRYIAFHEGYAYVTSYAGPILIDEDYAQLGYVAKVDTATLQVVARCTVGFQPDGIAVSGGRLYVANSGGYRVPNYENTLSIIDIATFTETGRVAIASNLSQVTADSQGKIWVSSRGDYFEHGSALYCYDGRKNRLEKTLDIPVERMWLHGDSLYTVSSGVYEPGGAAPVYGLIDTRSLEVLTRCFIAGGAEADIRHPYGLAVNPVTGEIYVTDARDFVNPGRLFSFTKEGNFQWQVRTGDIPSDITFY